MLDTTWYPSRAASAVLPRIEGGTADERVAMQALGDRCATKNPAWRSGIRMRALSTESDDPYTLVHIQAWVVRDDLVNGEELLYRVSIRDGKAQLHRAESKMALLCGIGTVNSDSELKWRVVTGSAGWRR